MILTLIAWILAVPAIAILSIFVAEMFAGLASGRKTAAPAPERPFNVAVIMPAHNEATLIVHTLQALAAVLPPNTRVVVVADNCTDDTARLARTQDVVVIERTDPERRGKGFALAFARDTLAAAPLDAPPDVVVIVDADCVPAAGTLATLAAAALEEDRPLQAVYLLRNAPDAPPMVQISSFAFLVKNLIRQRGSARLADVGILGGTGMALPWHLFAEAPLASDDIVEDLALGIWATRGGHPPRLLEGARVESAAAARGDTLGQRARWEHGFLQTARTQAVPLIVEGIGRRNGALFWLGLHLCVPPLAFLIATTAGIVAVLAALIALGTPVAPFAILVAMGGLAALGIVLAWVKEGRGVLSAGALLQAPLYVLWKIPIYLKLLTGRRSGWQRTPRDGENSGG